LAGENFGEIASGRILEGENFGEISLVIHVIFNPQHGDVDV